ncbi:MAG: efflux transporter outer membrane subunit [Planctomycetota bacterium]
MAIVAAAAAAGCATHVPQRIADEELGIDVPEQYAASASEASATETAAVDTRTANGQDAAAAPRIDWWREFGNEALDQLIATGLANNRNLQASLARLMQATAAHDIAGGPLLPEFDVSLDANRARRLFLGFPFGGGGTPSTTFTTYGLSLGVRWELDVWGRLSSADSAALADQQSALENMRFAQISLCAQIARAWFAAIEAKQQLDLASASADAFRATRDDVRDRFERGVRPALEVHQAQTNLANAEAAVAQRRELLQRTLRRLEVLIGSYPKGALALADTLPQALPMIPAGLPSELLRRRPDLRAAERRVAAAGCRVDAAEASLYPRLALTASGGTQSLELEDLVDSDFRVWSLGANLLEPLFRGGALRAEVRRQQAARAEALANYSGAVLDAFAEVEDLLASGVLLATRLGHLADAADNATSARDLAIERWQLGLADFLTVADGQRQAFAAESQRLLATRQQIDNRIDLLLALGGGYGSGREEPEGGPGARDGNDEGSGSGNGEAQ